MNNIKTIFTNASFFIDNQLQHVDIGVDEKGYIALIDPSKKIQQATSEIALHDLQNAFVYPGFEDAHNHPARRSRTLHEIDLRNKKVTWTEAKEIIIEELKEKDNGEWLVCHGWSDSWGEVTQKDLDELSTNKGIFLIHSSYHAGLINSFGLSLLKDKGIKINHEAGVAHEDDFEIAENATAPGTAVYFQTIKEYLQKFASLGITAVHDMYIANINQLQAYKYLVETNDLTMPIVGYLDSRLLDKGDALKPFFEEQKNFVVAGIKLFIDGTFGTRTAALYDAYKDDIQNGVIRADVEVCLKRIQQATALGLTHVAMHCIGARGIDAAIEIHKAAKAAKLGIKIWRLEHCEMPSDLAMRYMTEHGIIASMQPNFLWDSCNYENRLGKDIQKLNQFQKLLDAGVQIIFGSDDMPSGPLDGIGWVTKKAPFKEQQLSVEQSISLYSKTAPQLLGVLDRGEIKVGQYANFVVVDTMLGDDIVDSSHIVETWVQGVLRYKRN